MNIAYYFPLLISFIIVAIASPVAHDSSDRASFGSVKRSDEAYEDVLGKTILPFEEEKSFPNPELIANSDNDPVDPSNLNDLNTAIAQTSESSLIDNFDTNSFNRYDLSTTNSHSDVDALIADCQSDVSPKTLFQKRDSPPSKGLACPVNILPPKVGIPQGPLSNPTINPHPIDFKRQVENNPHPCKGIDRGVERDIHLSCGGPIVGSFRELPDIALNCVPGTWDGFIHFSLLIILFLILKFRICTTNP